MANIQKLTYPYFTDGTTQLNAANLNPIIAKLNEVIDKVNGGVTPTQTVATPTISISGTTATISCTTSGATIRYAINGTPTESSGTIIASGGTVDLSSYSSGTIIRAIAYKSGMTTSQVAETTYTPSVSPEAQAALAKFSNLSSAQQTKVKNLIDTLVSAGIYSKIHYLSLPLVAGTVPEALQNILSTETPPTIEFGTINGGLKFSSKGSVDLTSTINGTMDYEAITLAFAGIMDTNTPGNTSRAIVCNQASGQSTATRIFYMVTNEKCYFKGFDGEKKIDLESNNNVVVIASHDKTNSVEKYCYDSTGEITSAADTQTATNDGLVLSSSTDQSANSYNSYFSGTYKFVMLADTLTDAQITALNTAIRTFIA